MTNSKNSNGNTTKNIESTSQKTPHPFDAHTLMWLMVIFAAYSIFAGFFGAKTPEISYTELKKAVTSNQVSSISFRGDQIYGIYSGGTENKPKTFHTVTPPDLRHRVVTVARKKRD